MSSSNENDRSGASVTPISSASSIPSRRGRPKVVQKKPTSDDLLYHAEMMRRKTAYIEVDPVVSASRQRVEAIETLQRVKEELAKETAILQFSRIEEEKYGRDTTQMSSRRVAALREVAHIELEIRKLGVTMIDLKGERFQRIFQFFLECVREAASEVSSPEQMDLLFNRLETKLDGWEDKAQQL